MHFVLLFKLVISFVLISLINSGAVLAQELVIVHTNDFHGHIQETQKYAGAARIGRSQSDPREQRSCYFPRCWRRYLRHASIEHV